MSNRTAKFLSVVVAAGLATQACVIPRKKSGTGTNVGSGTDIPAEDGHPKPGLPQQ